jgi:hypothetical protein
VLLASLLFQAYLLLLVFHAVDGASALASILLVLYLFPVSLLLLMSLLLPASVLLLAFQLFLASVLLLGFPFFPGVPAVVVSFLMCPCIASIPAVAIILLLLDSFQPVAGVPAFAWASYFHLK